MSVSFRPPPSSRDFLVYQRIVIDSLSTRTVAEEVKLSQTRVRQIALRVLQWLVETLPSGSELSDAAVLRVGQHIAADRLERFYGEANRAWLQTTQPKFANLCIRVIAAQMKVAAFPGTLEALAMDAIYGPLPEESADLVTRVPPGNALPRGSSLAEPPTSPEPQDSGLPDRTLVTSAASSFDLSPSSLMPPPVRACSPAPAPPPKSASQPASVSAATRSDATSCDHLSSASRVARSAFLAPAHLADDAITELKITPQELGFQKTPTRSVSEGLLTRHHTPTRSVSERRLTRRERHRLKRKLGA